MSGGRLARASSAPPSCRPLPTAPRASLAGTLSALVTNGDGSPLGVQQLVKADVLALKKGMVFALENTGHTTAQFVAFVYVREPCLLGHGRPAGRPPPQPTNQPPPACRSDTQPSVGTFRGAQTLFPLFGAQGPLASLTPDMLASALNVTAPAVAALRTKYASLPLMHKPVASPRYASPAPPARGYTWNMDADIAKTGLRTPGAGGVSVGNKTGARWGWGLLGGWGW